jgi:hypothetical protein
MSYQLIELKLENFARQISDTKPLYLPMGALASNDATTLRVSVVVGAITGGTAALSLEESMDGGLTWAALTTSTNGPISGAGTYQVWLTDSSGIVAPNVRLKVLPSAGQSMYITKVYRTYATGDIIIPRSSGSGGGGGATEATLQKLREWPYAAYDSFTTAWNAGTFTEVVSYRTGGVAGTVVGTITTVFTDAVKTLHVSTVYSPQLVV